MPPGEFCGPSIDEFFPEPVLFIGTPFEMNRILIIRMLVVIVLILVFVLATRNLKLIPNRAQVAFEVVTGFVRDSIIISTLGEKNGRRFMPLLFTIFFLTLGLNLTGHHPGAADRQHRPDRDAAHHGARRVRRSSSTPASASTGSRTSRTS